MNSSSEIIHCKAAVCWSAGQSLSIEEVEVDPPKKGEVRVKMMSCGVCHSDITARDGHLNMKYPVIVGHEAAGIVESIGELVSSVSVGDYVLMMAIGQCTDCGSCKNPNSNFCTNFHVVGCMFDGTTRIRAKGQTVYSFCGVGAFSEYIVTNEERVVKVNPTANIKEVCLFACSIPTGYGSAVNVAKVQPGNTVAVWGLGAIGLAAVVGAVKQRAALVVGIDCNESKREIALKLGCHHFINPFSKQENNKTTEEVIKSLTNGLGLDVAIECVGGSDVVFEAINCTAPWGLTVVVGFAEPSQKLKISPNVFLSGRQVKGAVLGGYKVRDQIPPLVDKYVDGKFEIKELITGKMRLNEINKAFDCLIQGKSLRTIIVFD